MASPTAEDHVSLEATIADLTRDPYQREFDTFSAQATIAGAAAQVEECGIINRSAPLVAVDRIDFSGTAVSGFTINLARQQIATLGLSWAASICSYNEGVPTGYPGAGRTTSNTTNWNLALAGPATGIPIASFPTTAAGNVLLSWIPPYPVLLFPQPAQIGPGLSNGDGLFVVALAASLNLTATVYWREWANFRF